MRKVLAGSTGEGGEELEKLKEDLAEQLRLANTSGVTRWLGLKERLDFGVLHDIENYRELLRAILLTKLSENDSGDTEDEVNKKGTARELLDALEAYEEGLKKKSEDENSAA